MDFMLNEENVTGSTFFRMGKSPLRSSSSDGRTSLFKKQILIFSRDFDTQLLLKTFLGFWGFSSQIAEVAEQVLPAISTSQPSLILIDSVLPFSAHIEVIRLIRRTRFSRQTPIIVISGFSQTRFKEMSFAAGADEFLVKPLDFELFENYLKRFIEIPRKKSL